MVYIIYELYEAKVLEDREIQISEEKIIDLEAEEETEIAKTGIHCIRNWSQQNYENKNKCA